MKRRPKPRAPEENLAADAAAILRIKVRLPGISPVVWRRVLVPATFTLRELHGVIQVATGWEGVHLYDFQLRAARYGSREVAASSPDVTLAGLRSFQPVDLAATCESQILRLFAGRQDVRRVNCKLSG
jgi:hypothetical protein